MAIRAGQEIDAWCTRCKMDLTHKVVAAVGDKPAKVECRTCYTIHMYRAPKSSPAAIQIVRTTRRIRRQSTLAKTSGGDLARPGSGRPRAGAPVGNRAQR